MLSFQEIIERTEREIEFLRTAPIGTEFNDMEIEDEKERARLIRIAGECLENLRNSRPAYVEACHQKRSIIFNDNFMN